MTGPGGTREPGNRKDRARFDFLSESEQVSVAEDAARRYDGSRTVARCWAEALDAAGVVAPFGWRDGR